MAVLKNATSGRGFLAIPSSLTYQTLPILSNRCESPAIASYGALLLAIGHPWAMIGTSLGKVPLPSNFLEMGKQ